ncbi:IclR family transcriptional regulator [Gordonia sp. KTR9]|uniref:IclR family transcriptional regulator n=1 Tax=Gordonia sp. KTR9 TaxID=337191 RepID=UPI00027DD817|nr:Transcriptional regulator [Gordonia sp. KTR9]
MSCSLDRLASESASEAPVDSAAEDRSVIARAFLVLAALDDNRSSVSLASLAKRTGLPKGSLHRLCAQLASQGAVERTDLGYRLGFRMFELGAQASLPRRLRELSLPLMAELHASTKFAVHLSVLVNSDVFIVNSISGRATLGLSMAPGGRYPALGTAAGKVLLALAPERECEEALGTIANSARVQRELSKIATDELACHWTRSKLQALGVPITSEDGAVVAALSVCSHDLAAQQQQATQALRGTAAAIEKKLLSTSNGAYTAHLSRVS